ncbi:uncharacterized protein LOC143902099 [Temnothorax americanus]|uniref:uncharacterized protein LOC143902099 n=1 Tax=Temnothorax americanus TaxID=1964332 RepID=UPI0040696D00
MFSSKDDDANGQVPCDQSKSTAQAPDTESEVMEVISTLSGKTSDEVNNTVVETKQLDEETKKVLGEDPESGKQKDIDLHPDLVSRWSKWVKEGLTKETKTEVLAKYSRKGNLSLEAPALNDVVAATLNEAGTKRDNLFIQEQNFAGTALAALGEAITMILKDEEEPIDRMKLLERLADTGKLLTQLHFQISSARKAFIAPALTKQVKDLLQKTTPGEFLYGDKLGEVIKSAKSMEKLGKEIKVQKAPVSSTVSKKPNSKYTGRNLNWRSPYSRPGTSNQGYRTSQTSSKFSKNQQYNKPKQTPQAKTQPTQQEKQQ